MCVYLQTISVLWMMASSLVKDTIYSFEENYAINNKHKHILAGATEQTQPQKQHVRFLACVRACLLCSHFFPDAFLSETYRWMNSHMSMLYKDDPVYKKATGLCIALILKTITHTHKYARALLSKITSHLYLARSLSLSSHAHVPCMMPHVLRVTHTPFFHVHLMHALCSQNNLTI